MVKARVLRPDAELFPVLNELEEELASLAAENTEQNGTENGHDSTIDQSNETINNSVYSTPLIKEKFQIFLSIFRLIGNSDEKPPNRKQAILQK